MRGDIPIDFMAAFSFIAKNPPMACIVGGILFLLLSVLSLASGNLLLSLPLLVLGIALIALGVFLHLLWLRSRGGY